MQECPSCGAVNSPAAERCEKCGAWFERNIDGTPAISNTPQPIAPQPIASRELPPASTFEGRVLRLLQAGQKIQAIKLFREETRVGLKEAKDSVEALGRRHGLKVEGSGCAGAVVILCSFVVAILGAVVRLMVD